MKFENKMLEKQKLPPLVRKKCYLSYTDLLKRIGHAESLAERYEGQILREEFKAPRWRAAIENFQSNEREKIAVQLKLTQMSKITGELIPRGRKLISRLKKVIEGQLGIDHEDVQSTLADYLKGVGGSVSQRLSVLWRYVNTHQELVPISPLLSREGPSIEEVVSQLDGFDKSHRWPLKVQDRQLSNQRRAMMNDVFEDLKQFVHLSKVMFEASAVEVLGEFEGLIRRG